MSTGTDDSQHAPPPEVLTLLHKIKGALSVWIADVELELGLRSGALSFDHPLHGATVMVVVEAPDPPAADPDADADAADERTPAGCSVGVFVILGDYADVRGDDEALTRLFGLNARLMSCAIGLLRLSQDETALALCRRLPAASVDITEVRELVDAMIWEYADHAGHLSHVPVADSAAAS